jgi:hypothetical protein
LRAPPAPEHLGQCRQRIRRPLCQPKRCSASRGGPAITRAQPDAACHTEGSQPLHRLVQLRPLEQEDHLALGEQHVVPLDAECFQIERGALLDQRRRVRKRPLPERDDDSDQLRLLARDRGREQLVQLTQHAEPASNSLSA